MEERGGGKGTHEVNGGAAFPPPPLLPPRPKKEMGGKGALMAQLSYSKSPLPTTPTLLFPSRWGGETEAKREAKAAARQSEVEVERKEMPFPVL